MNAVDGLPGVPWLECQGIPKECPSAGGLVQLSKDSVMPPVKPGSQLSLGDGHSITCNPESWATYAGSLCNGVTDIYWCSGIWAVRWSEEIYGVKYMVWAQCGVMNMGSHHWEKVLIIKCPNCLTSVGCEHCAVACEKWGVWWKSKQLCNQWSCKFVFALVKYVTYFFQIWLQKKGLSEFNI